MYFNRHSCRHDLRSEKRATLGESSIEEIKRELRAAPGAWRDVQKIAGADVDQKALLAALAMAVMTEPTKSAASRIRKTQKDLRSLARQIRTVSHYAERVALDPCTYLDLWSPFANQAFG